MLFYYKYINHEVEKFQKYLDFLFFEVWCKAKKPFSSKRLSRLPELQIIYERLHNEDTKGAFFFNGHIEDIYEEFRRLNKPDRKKLKKWYRLNNNISRLCNDRSLHPVNYRKLMKEFPSLGKRIKSFYTKLYGSESPLHLAAFGDFGKIVNDHYKSFMETNDEEICPFCGIKEMKSIHHSKREAYDHFIPKSKYPFNAVNFKNLAPMCDDCNSSYKLAKEPIKHLDPITKKVTNVRRKSFYPYSNDKLSLRITVNLNTLDYQKMTKDDIVIRINSVDKFSHLEQIESWREVYGIDERYKAKILGKRGAKKWHRELQEAVNLRRLSKDCKKTVEDLYNMKIKEAGVDLLDNGNFIKKAFLEECRDKGLFLN